MNIKQIQSVEDLDNYIEGCINDFESGESSKEETVSLISTLIIRFAEMSIKMHKKLDKDVVVNLDAQHVTGNNQLTTAQKFICPCGSDKTHKTEAYYCKTCAVTTEV